MNYRRLCLFLILLIHGSAALAQRFDAPLLTLKTNVLAAPAGNINAAVEFVIKHQRTLDDLMTTINLPVSYNPFTYSSNKKIKHIAFLPELRIHKPLSFGSVFLGANAIYAFYNVGGVDLPFNIAHELTEKRYQGQLFGAGITGGYYLKLGFNVGLEGTMGVGVANMDHTVYKCPVCGTRLGEENKNYVGITKAAVSVVYTLK